MAAAAGVSFKTVSRVINEETTVRAATREKVLKAIRELGYSPNHNARNLRTKRSRRIGLLVSNPSRFYLSELQWGAIQRCQAEGYSLAVASFDTLDTSPLLRGDGKAMAGLILPPPLCEDEALLDGLEARQIPYVQIAAVAGSRRGDCVFIDDRAAAKEMTEHLIAQGHRRIGFIGSPETFAQTKEREVGYREALNAAGIEREETWVRDGAFTFESGREAASALLDLDRPPTAIFAANDDMAAGVLAESYRRQMHVPDDLAIAGFDDTPLATVMTPALTSVYQPVSEMADSAVGLLLRRVREPEEEPKQIALSYDIRPRATTLRQ